MLMKVVQGKVITHEGGAAAKGPHLRRWCGEGSSLMEVVQGRVPI